MSGPKVVRIVTREEVEARCRRLITTVEAEMEALRVLAKRLGQYDDQREAQLQARLAGVRALMQNERWVELQKQAPQQIEYVRAEAVQLRERAVAIAAAKKRRGRQLADTARSLALLDVAAHSRPELQEISERAPQAGETELAAMEQKLTDFAKQIEIVHTSENQSALVKALTEGQIGEAVKWVPSNVGKEKEVDRLDSLLAEIEIFADPNAIEMYKKRAEEIRLETSSDKLSLLIDSLMLDASKYVRTVRDLAECRKLLVAASNEIKELTTAEAAGALVTIESAIHTGDLQVAIQSLAVGQAVIARHQNQEAARSRREAILSGLTSLGYEVTEGMSTAWVRDGRIVVRKPGQVDYGVEFGAPASIDRFQVRLVGSDNPATPRSEERDRDAETIWCGDFDRLQESLSKTGATLVIERALGVGAEAVKTVSSGQLIAETTDNTAPQSRSLT